MITTPPCKECFALSGAPPSKLPHPELLKNPDAKDRFRCADCGYRWAVGPEGWANVWD